jgi:hypothetical protein
MDLRKDRALDQLAQSGNVAQFVSFAPGRGGAPEQTYSRVWNYTPNHCFSSEREALEVLLASSQDRSLNLRSFTPSDPRSREFIYGLKDTKTALGHLQRLTGEGLFVIANETVDVSDGGVSGVVEGGVIEFAPDDTPRCVEKSGTASFKFEDGIAILKTAYGFQPDFGDCNGHRIEFSIHPNARGFHRTHSLLWEREQVSTCDQRPILSWPNNFSRLVGDKVFGLLIANLVGMLVPRSLVISRRLRPFSFGHETGSRECWLRTCPTEQNPGRYSTVNKWVDPFALLSAEDPSHRAIASVISQDAVPACFSGAAITKKDGRLHIEGTMGTGDNLMLGRARPEQLPDRIVSDVQQINAQLRERLGPVRFEWVHDGTRVWIVQLHKGGTQSTSTIIVPGDPTEWATFRSDAGLEALRTLLADLPSHVGLKLEGEVGLTSHLADLARKSGRPTRIVRHKKASMSNLLFDLED